MSIRQEKIASLLKRELADIFQRENKSLAKGAFVTVTVVRVTADLSLARVYLSLFKAPDKDELVAHINGHEWQVKKALVQRLGKNMRKVPELRFYLDDSLDYVDEIDNLLKK